MSSWNKYFTVLIAITLFHNVKAQDVESAPQEPPFVQEENEFETSPSVKKQTKDMPLSIEDEVQSAEEGLEENKKTVDLNKKPDSEKKTEEAHRVEEKKPLVAEPAVIPVSPRIEVKPPQPQRPKVVRQPGKGNVEYIEHPLAAKGLTTITKDGSYIYKTAEIEEKHKSGSFRLGMMDPPKIKAADGTTFEAMYSGNQQSVLMFDYEWHPFSGYGKLGVQAGFGLLLAYGNGRFVSSNASINGTQAKEKYTFAAFPLNLGVVYRLEWLHRQWFAPYVSGGGTYIPVAEIRDDGKSPNAVGTPGAYGAGGVLFNISAINRDTAFTLQSEYGITNLWVSIDYRYLQTFNDQLDFSSSIIGGGIVVDY